MDFGRQRLDKADVLLDLKPISQKTIRGANRSVKLSSSMGSSSNPSGKLVDDGSFPGSSSSCSSMGDGVSETVFDISGIVSSPPSRERGLVVDGSRRENERAPRSEGRSGEADLIEEVAEADCWSGTGLNNIL